MSATLTQEQTDRLAGALETATARLNETRAQMDQRQAEIGQALTRFKTLEEAIAKGNSDGGTERDALKKRLEELAGQVQSLAQQNTNLVELTRKQTLRLADAGTAEDKAFRVPGGRGAVFDSRRQAVELGYFFMATMKSNQPCKEYARKWLQQNANELCYLPNLPRSFIQHLGAEHDKVLQRCLKQGLQYAAQDLASNVTPGSVLTFPQFASVFIRNVELYGAFRRNALVWPMGAETVYIPRRTGGLTVYWVGEASAPSESEPNFDMLTMIAKKMMGLTQYSSELAEDESAAMTIADIIVTEFAQAVAYEEDRIGFNGTATGGNSPGYAGFYGVLGLDRQAYAAEGSEDQNKVLKYDAATGLDRTDEVTLKGLRAVIGLCHTWARVNAKWYAHRTVMQDLYGIETTGGGPITSSDASNRTQLLGYGTEETEAMPASPGTASTGVFAFGDLRRAWALGDRRAVEIETSEHYAFNTDQLTVRLATRKAFLPIEPRAIVVYVTAA